jgi:hypothetical protein
MKKTKTQLKLSTVTVRVLGETEMKLVAAGGTVQTNNPLACGLNAFYRDGGNEKA